MAIVAIRRYGLSQEQRIFLLDEALRICKDSPEEKTRLLAIKMAVEMDKVDAKREETEVQEKHHEVMEATAVMRIAMQDPAIREQLAKLSDHVCKLPVEIQEEIDDAQKMSATQVLSVMERMGPKTNGHA